MDEELQRPAQVLLCALLFLLLAFYNAGIASRSMIPTGDEPHYLVATHSLAYDRDISLLNNYQEQHYRFFYPAELAKRTTPSADHLRELPAEGIGLPILLAPAYRLARAALPSTWTIPALRILMCSITIIVLWLILSILQLAGIASAGTWLYAAAAFLCSPLLFYSGQFYPEMPAALCVAAAVHALFSLEEHPQRSLAALGLLPGALVWLHPKYVVLALALLAVSAVHLRRTFRVYREWKTTLRMILLVAVGAAGILSFFVFLRYEYGGWSPNRIYAGWEPQQQKTLWELVAAEGFSRITIMIRMLGGFWLDQRFGLLAFAPFYAAFPAALLYIWKRRPPFAAPVIILLAVHFLTLCWGAPLGGHAPPSRHLVVLMPLLLFAILYLFTAWNNWQKWIFASLVLLSGFLSFAMLTNYRMLFANVTWRARDARSPFWQNWKLENILPSFTATDLPWISILAAVLVAGAIVWLLAVPAEREVVEAPVEPES